MLRVVRVLLDKGCPCDLVFACLRAQILPEVSLDILGHTLPVGRRAIGTITGSRLAGAVGQVIIHECLESYQLKWETLGFKTGSFPLAICTWVDNVYAFSNKLGDAITVLEDLERQLISTWGLIYKNSSRACIFCRGSAAQPIDPI